MDCLNNKYNQEDCSICFKSLQQTDSENQVAQLKCQHIFHKQCVEPWVNQHNSCPLCRKEAFTPPLSQRLTRWAQRWNPAVGAALTAGFFGTVAGALLFGMVTDMGTHMAGMRYLYGYDLHPIGVLSGMVVAGCTAGSAAFWANRPGNNYK